MLARGNTGVSSLRIGDAPVARLMRGDAEVWAPPPPPPTGLPRLTKTAGGVLSTTVAGTNIYDLLLSDKTNTVRRLPRAEVDARLDAAVAMNATAVRTHAWVSLGHPLSLMPTLGAPNEAAFLDLDYIVAAAGQRGLYLMAPIIDRWNFYHGGMITFARLHSNSTSQTDQTYRNWFYGGDMDAAFKAHLTAILTRTNTITGVRYVDDPTIGIIETINEGYDAPLRWTNMVLAHLRSIAPNTLLAEGSNAASGRYPNGTDAGGNQYGVDSLVLDCDVVGSHFYDERTRDIAWLNTSANMAAGAGKAYVVGEWGWTEGANGYKASNPGLSTRAQFCAAMEANPNVSGDMWWSLFTDPTGFTHDDGYQLFVPGQNAEQTAGATTLASHAANMTD